MSADAAIGQRVTAMSVAPQPATRPPKTPAEGEVAAAPPAGHSTEPFTEWDLCPVPTCGHLPEAHSDDGCWLCGCLNVAVSAAAMAQVHRDALADTGDAYHAYHGWVLNCLWCGFETDGKTKAAALRKMQRHYDQLLPEGVQIHG